MHSQNSTFETWQSGYTDFNIICVYLQVKMSHITEEEFNQYCDEFLEISRQRLDNWLKVTPELYGSYLIKKETRPLKRSFTTHPLKESIISKENKPNFVPKENDVSVLEEGVLNVNIHESDWLRPESNDDMLKISSIDDSVHDPSEFKIVSSYGVDIVTFEYHILYSLSHSVPMLCFEAYFSSGKPLTLEEIWSRVVDSDIMTSVYPQRWETITATEHPVKGSPCYFLHPCKTADLLKHVENISVADATCSTFTSESPRNPAQTSSHGNQPLTEVRLPSNSFDAVEVKSSIDDESCDTPAEDDRACLTSVSDVQQCDAGSETLGSLTGARYIISWLSMVGPVVGLKLDLEYFSL